MFTEEKQHSVNNQDEIHSRTNGVVLITGATGYVGGRLLKALESSGRPLQCLARRPEYLRSKVSKSIRVVGGDCLDGPSLDLALAGVHTAYYLVHSMSAGADFAKQDREAASNFGARARTAGVQKIIYLGGLGCSSKELSPHLRSRHETGNILRDSGVPVIEFRAGIVLGSGSLSFELIRALVERLPLMVCPQWVRTRTQPIAIEDLIAYLVAALELPGGSEQVFEIGGGVPVSYRDIMLDYARQRGLRRALIPVPLLTPKLSSLWLGLMSPLYARVGRTLIESLKNPTIVSNTKAREVFQLRPMTMPEAITRAMRNEDQEVADTRWSDAVSSAALSARWGGVRYGTRLIDTRSKTVSVSPSLAFRPIRQIGGARGWYHLDILWWMRGWIDLLLGGVGLRRGRRDPNHLSIGDALDWWRVEDYQPDQRLRLFAEMKLPGRAWLEFTVESVNVEESVIRQTAVFDPIGLSGLLYWYLVYPLHAKIFQGMLDGIATRAMTTHDFEA